MRRNPSLRAIAYHEAGHAVADLRFGFKPAGVSVIPRAGTLGAAQCLDDDHYDLARENGARVLIPNPDRGAKVVVALLAGYAAEVHHRPGSRAEARFGACDDFERARDILRSLGRKPALASSLRKARAFVAANWKAIDCVARDLAETKELDDTEVETIVAVADGSDPDAVRDLAQYRDLRSKGPTVQFPFRVLPAQAPRRGPRQDAVGADRRGLTGS